MAGKLQQPRGGGPKSPDGKGRSSQNARTHGVLSKALILDDERLEDYQAVEHGWHTQFAPADYQEERLVEILVRNDWMLQRAERRYLEAQAGDWTPEQRHQLELMQRYRTAAERSFYRAWNALRGLKRDLERAAKESAWLRVKTNKLEAQEAAAKKREERQAAERDANGLIEGRSGGVSARESGIRSAIDAEGSVRDREHVGQQSPQKLSGLSERGKVPGVFHKDKVFDRSHNLLEEGSRGSRLR